MLCYCQIWYWFRENTQEALKWKWIILVNVYYIGLTILRRKKPYVVNANLCIHELAAWWHLACDRTRGTGSWFFKEWRKAGCCCHNVCSGGEGGCGNYNGRWSNNNFGEKSHVGHGKYIVLGFSLGKKLSFLTYCIHT